MKGIERAVAIFKTQAALARAAGRFTTEINRWLKRGWVTPDHCEAIANAVNREIPKALAKGEIEPDIAYPMMLNELNSVFPIAAEPAAAES